jgi:hypothetical protein
MTNIKELTSKIIEYEQNELDDFDIVNLFSDLMTSGILFQLQGSYQRQAQQLINEGILDADGNITEQTWKIINKNQ